MKEIKEWEKKLREDFQTFADSIVWQNDDGSEKYIAVGNMSDWLVAQIISILSSEQTNWLRSEIEKLEIAQREHFCTPDNGNDYDHGAWEALTSIITRYKEELKVLESKQ